jgi:hypothetical protein
LVKKSALGITELARGEPIGSGHLSRITGSDLTIMVAPYGGGAKLLKLLKRLARPKRPTPGPPVITTTLDARARRIADF